MNIRTRSLALAVTVGALTAPVAAFVATVPAHASGKPVNCTKVATTYPGIVTRQTFAAGDAGSVTLKRDAVNDGLVVGRVVIHPGWTKSGEVKTGPKVSVQFQQRHTTVELEAAQSAQYYGPDILVVEIKTCSR